MKKTIGIQTALMPTPVAIIGSYNEDGSANMMNAAWAGIVASTPAAIGVSIRPQRKSLENIRRTGSFSVNITDKTYMVEADYFGVVSGHQGPKMEKVKLTTTKGNEVNAPIINEFMMNIECSVAQEVEIGSHVQLIGHIKEVHVTTKLINSDGKVDFSLVKPLIYDPLNLLYYELGDEVGKAFNLGLTLK